MDLRWQVQHVSGAIARTFGLRPPSGETQLWLFHAAPSATSEEPLSPQKGVRQPDQVTLRDLQRSATYLPAPTKRPFSLHAVEFAIPAAHSASELLCVRFYDEAVREVGNAVLSVLSAGTVQDVLVEARRHLQPSWGISGALRLLEVIEGRLHKHYRPDTPIRSLTCFGKSNLLYHCLRVEADPESGAGLPESHKPLEIFHCDRQSQQAFAQPLLLWVASGEKAGSVKARCKAKLQVPDAEFKSWRLVRCGRMGKTHLKDDEPWDSDPATDLKLCLEHVHPNPTNSFTRQSRYNKPLTIKG
jgi:hypothetical protein